MTILDRDGIELCERVEDTARVVIYADPPYLVKGANYVHDFLAADHHRLADVLSRFRRTRVVVSYYEHSLLAELYPGWTKIVCTTTKALVNGGLRTKGKVEAPEVLLMNGPALGGAAKCGLLFDDLENA